MYLNEESLLSPIIWHWLLFLWLISTQLSNCHLLKIYWKYICFPFQEMIAVGHPSKEFHLFTTAGAGSGQWGNGVSFPSPPAYSTYSALVSDYSKTKDAVICILGSHDLSETWYCVQDKETGLSVPTSPPPDAFFLQATLSLCSAPCKAPPTPEGAQKSEN